jgi:hypothetical protein
VLHYLAEAGYLAEVIAVSAISGSSISAAVLAEGWPQLERRGFPVAALKQHVSGPFIESVTERISETGVARWALIRVPRTGAD